MTKKLNNPPAFPQPIAIDSQGNIHTSSEKSDAGMDIRDWFAGMALQGILASDIKNEFPQDKIAEWAFNQADAMLAAREPLPKIKPE